MLNKLIKSAILLIVAVLTFACAFAQGTAGERASYETRYIIDMPTAGILQKGCFSVYSVTFSEGGLLAEISAAPFSGFSMGISYSGTNIIGEGEVTGQGIPGVQLRFRILDERMTFPAILVGVNIQGRGSYDKKFKRFLTQSPGLFLAVSKNFKWVIGSLATHAGINYSFEPPAKDRAPNIYFGIEQSLGSMASFNLEFNPNIDDNNKAFLAKKGLLNASLRWAPMRGFTIGLEARDLFVHYTGAKGFTRCLSLEYISSY